MKPRRFSMILTALIVIGLSAVRAPAQETPEVRYRYFYLVEANVKPGAHQSYIQSITGIVDAAKKQSGSQSFATFTTLAGTPTYYHFLPLRQVGEMDQWKPLMQMMSEAHGPQKAANLMTAMTKSAESTSLLLVHDPEMSNPPPMTSPPAPPPILYRVTVQIDSEKISAFTELSQKIIRATRKNPKSMRLVAYRNMIGGDGMQVHLFGGMQKFAEMDETLPLPAILAGEYGQQQAMQLLNDIGAAAEVKVEFLRFVPELSHFKP